MPKFLPTLALILAVLLALTAGLLIVENASTITLWHFGQQVMVGQSMAYPMGLAAFLLGGSVALFAWVRALQLQTQGRRANRELERQNVTSEAAENRIEILEGQVRTLEAALERALKSSFPKA
jgi:type VI protein secretion system component VasK